MFRVLLTLLLLATGPGQAARGAVPGSPFGPALPQNQAPETVDYIDVGTLYVGGSSAKVNASSYFSDPDGDTLTYSVNNPSPAVATVSISGSTVTVTPVAVGNTSKIVVTAEDPGGLTATQDFNVTVENTPPPNRAPTAVGSISDVTLQVGGSSATRSVSGKFSDPDGDTLTYSVNDPDTSTVTVSISGSTVTIAPVAAGTTGKIVVTARDPGGLTATQDFTATVENPPVPPVQPNRAPTAVGSISDVTLQVGGSSATRSVSGKFSDPDGDALTYSVNDPNPSTVTVSISGSTVTIAPVAAGTTGKIIVTARDPGGLTATQDFTVTVSNPPPPPPTPNRAPTAVGSISDVSLSKGGSSATRSVSGKFSDPDGDTLTYSVNNPTPSIAAVSISGSTVTISPVATGSTGKIIVTARDPDGETATQDFTATVVNDPPQPEGSISDVTLYKKGKTRSVSVSSKFSDPNGDTLTYSASSSRTSVATVSVSGSTVTVRSGVIGTATVTVTATDTDDATGTQNFDVRVINRPPGLRKIIPAMTFHRNQAAQSVDLSDHFNDEDNDALTYTASSGDTSVATVSVSGSSISVDPGILGSTRITVTAEDTDNARRTHSFSVAVENRPPRVTRAISAISLNKNRSTSINASSHFSDPDGDTITFSARTSNTGMVSVSVSGNSVTISSKNDGGDATITVTATDALDDSVSTDFTVTVLNRSPRTRGSISGVSLYKKSHTLDVDVSGKFTDPDEDTLTYSATSSNTAVASASVSGSAVTITSGNSGSATITVKAEDIDKASAMQTFDVLVTNRAPEIVDSFEDVNLRVGGTSKRFDVSGHFSDPDSDTLRFSVDNPDTSVAAVSISGSEVTVAPKSQGEIGKVTVTATDSDPVPASISEDFRVVVGPEDTTPPPCPTANTVPISVPAMSDGGDSVTMDVSAYFTIPQGVTSTYSANNPSPGIAVVSISGNTLTIRPVTQGHTGKVIVTASATGCTDVTRDFNISVGPPKDPPPPSCPTVNTVPITVPTMSHGGDSVTIDVSAYFTIPTGVTATYSANNPSPGIANVSISGDTLTIEPIAQGDTGKVIVTVSATGCTNVTRDFNVSVGPPVVPPPPSCPTANTEVIEVSFVCVGGDPVTMVVSNYFTIPTGVSPTYEAYNPDTTKANVSISGDTLTIDPKTHGDTGKVIITASTDGCDDVTRDFNVNVAAAPSASECPAVKQAHPSRDVALTVGGSDFEVNLNDHFTNLASNGIDYVIESSNSYVATASRTDTTLTISPGIAGTAQVTITVSRCGCETAVSQVFNVTVETTVPPCPAAVNTIPSQTLTVGDDAMQLDVSPYFNISEGVTPTYAVNNPDSTIAGVSNSGSTVTITPVSQGQTGKIIVTVSASGCSDVTQDFTVTVMPPEITVTVSPASASIQKGETQQFTAKATDSAGTEITGKTFTWESSATTVATINSLGLATAVTAGMTTITATTDDVSGSASLTVTEPPICPMLKGSITNRTLTLGGSAAPIDLTQYFSLPVDFVPTYVVSSTDTSVTTTSLAGAMLTVTPSAAGMDTVSVTVSKQDCDSVKQSFVVTVNLPCPSTIADAPIPDQTLVVGAGTTQIDLTQHFEHIDRNDIEITVTSPSPGIATAVIEGTNLKIDPVAAGQIAAVTVTISDTAESDPCDAVSLSFMVTVEAAVEHPGLYPWSVSGEDVYRLTGNVGIGVEAPDQKLVVDGTIKAEGYRLKMIPADYVFEEGYDLLSLDEVALYIRNHGHLPGVDSGAEMKANGLGISRMQTTLLEKIEELSLYIIAQHEQLRVQGHRLASQQQKLEARKTQARELEQRLRRWER